MIDGPFGLQGLTLCPRALPGRSPPPFSSLSTHRYTMFESITFSILPPVVRTTAVKAELASIKSSIDSLLAMPVSRAAPNPLTPCLL
jgi:hypothetical protein